MVLCMRLPLAQIEFCVLICRLCGPVPNGPWPGTDKGLGTPDLEGGDSSSLALA